MLRRSLLWPAAAALLGACAAEPTQDAQGNAVARQAPACEDAVTGSNIRRCARDNSQVEVMSRDEFERLQNRNTNVPRNPDSPRGR